REVVTVLLNTGPYSGRRETCASDYPCDLFELRSSPWKIARDFDCQPSSLRSLAIDQIDIPSLFVDNRIGSSRRAHDVEVLVPRDLSQILVVGPIRKQVHRMIAI